MPLAFFLVRQHTDRMSFNDKFRLSAHGVIIENNKVLQVKANYGSFDWGLPGGALEPDETIHEALLRECEEELGFEVHVDYLSGVYFHSHFNSQAFIFRIRPPDNYIISLSDEHTDYRFFSLDELSDIQLRRIKDCLNYQGVVQSYKF